MTARERRDAVLRIRSEWTRRREAELFLDLGEPALGSDPGIDEAYRFSWVQSYRAALVVRLERRGERITSIFALGAPREAGRKHSSRGLVFRSVPRTVDAQAWSRVDLWFRRIDFWNLSADDGEIFGGAEWCLEGYRNGRTHAVRRKSPRYRGRDGWFARTCLHMVDAAEAELDSDGICRSL